MKQNNQSVRIGLIGLGNMGQNHLRILSMLKTVDLVFVHDSDKEKASRLAQAHQTRAFDDLDDAYAQGVDAVVICTPTATHADYIEQALAHVQNIFVEKPMTATLSEANKIARLIEGRNINLQVGFIERFNPAVHQLKKVLDKSSRVINIDFTRTNKLDRITDVDVISDLMVHDIDLALYLNGPIAEIHAHGVVDKGLVSFASAILTHKNGKFSRIQASRITDKKMRKIEATCEDIFVDCELVRKEIIVTSKSHVNQITDKAFTISAIQEAIEVKPEEALLLQHQSFVASCQGVSAARNPNLQDGLESLRICAIIQKEIYRD